MNKEQAKERLCAIETEVEKLRRIIDEPEQRTPEAGDVWRVDGHDYHVGYGRRATSLKHGDPLSDPLEEYFASSKCTYLGKFDEVFVKISDVREALSIEDRDGDSVLASDPSREIYSKRISILPETTTLIREALRKLNIIKD